MEVDLLSCDGSQCISRPYSRTQELSAHPHIYTNTFPGSVQMAAAPSPPLPVGATLWSASPLPENGPSRYDGRCFTRMTGEFMFVGFWWLPCCTEAAQPKQVSQTSNWPTELCKGCSTLARMGAEPSSTRNSWTCIAWFTSPRMGVQPSSTRNLWM